MKDRFLGIIIFLISLGLLIREIVQFNNLNSKSDSISELVDFYKYKEDCISNSFLWLSFLIVGILLTKRNKWTIQIIKERKLIAFSLFSVYLLIGYFLVQLLSDKLLN
jgi:hypothetical protein